VRTKPEDRNSLAIPWELSLWDTCKNHNALPFAGGVLDQPHILMTCFDIIDSELAAYHADQEKIREVNKRLKEAHEKK